MLLLALLAAFCATTPSFADDAVWPATSGRVEAGGTAGTDGKLSPQGRFELVAPRVSLVLSWAQPGLSGRHMGEATAMFGFVEPGPDVSQSGFMAGATIHATPDLMYYGAALGHADATSTGSQFQYHRFEWLVGGFNTRNDDSSKNVKGGFSGSRYSGEMPLNDYVGLGFETMFAVTYNADAASKIGINLGWNVSASGWVSLYPFGSSFPLYARPQIEGDYVDVHGQNDQNSPRTSMDKLSGRATTTVGINF